MPTFNGTPFDDILTGTEGDDFIYGGAGNDILDGRGGNDTLDGGDGDDVLIGSAGTDAYDGGAGFDTLSFANWLGSGVNVELGSPFGPIRPGFVSIGGVASGRTTGIERVIGSAFADRLTGNRFGETTLEGGDGDDTLEALGDNNILIGGRGADHMRISGSGNLIIAEGNDTISGLYEPAIAANTVRFSGRYADYQITQENGATVFTRADERISVSRIERYEFADVVLTGPLTGTQDILGSSGADRIRGTREGDRIIGGDGDDILIGDAGYDILDGGAGVDTAGYLGLMRGYTLTRFNTAFSTVIGGLEGGQDNLISIERLSFLDGTIYTDASSTAAAVLRLYDAAFNRLLPDQSGLSGWVDRIASGMSLAQAADAFVSAAELGGRYTSLSNEAFVREMYRVSLDREGEAAGVTGWVAQLNAGASRGSVLLAFSESAEHRNLTAWRVADGIFVEDARTIALARLFDTAFDRLPDQAGMVQWRPVLDTGGPLLSVANAFVASQEFQSRYGGLDNTAFVQQLYRLSLNREPDTGGLQTWTARLDAGTTRAELLVLFSESFEHVTLTDRFWRGGVQFTTAAAGTVETVTDKATDALILPDPADGGWPSMDDAPVHLDDLTALAWSFSSPSAFDAHAQAQAQADWFHA